MRSTTIRRWSVVHTWTSLICTLFLLALTGLPLIFHHELEHLHNRLRADIKGRYDELSQLLDDAGDFALATERVRRLMFLEKLLHEIDDALASLEE